MKFKTSLFVAIYFQNALSNGLSIGMGSGIDIGQAGEYNPYVNIQDFHFTPTVYLQHKINKIKINFDFTIVNARNYCVFCKEKVFMDFYKLNISPQLAFYKMNLGLNMFYQWGHNKYEMGGLKIDPMITYSGSLNDYYNGLGVGLVVEVEAFKYCDFGIKLNTLKELERNRTNNIIEYDKDSGRSRPMIFDNSAGSPVGIEFYFKFKYELIKYGKAA